MSDDGYLSRNRAHLAQQRRQRRAYRCRIDYAPSRAALAAIEAARKAWAGTGCQPSNGALLDALVQLGAEAAGLINRDPVPAKAPRRHPSRQPPAKASDGRCGARRHRDGHPCRAYAVPGKRRCKFHGGCSTGPKTAEGRAKALANLRQYRPADTAPAD